MWSIHSIRESVDTWALSALNRKSAECATLRREVSDLHARLLALADDFEDLQRRYFREQDGAQRLRSQNEALEMRAIIAEKGEQMVLAQAQELKDRLQVARRHLGEVLPEKAGA